MLYHLDDIISDFPDFEFKEAIEEKIQLNEGNHHKGTASVIRVFAKKDHLKSENIPEIIHPEALNCDLSHSCSYGPEIFILSIFHYFHLFIQSDGRTNVDRNPC